MSDSDTSIEERSIISSLARDKQLVGGGIFAARKPGRYAGIQL